METPLSIPGNARRHARNISHPTPTRATRGPLEEVTDDPLAESTQSTSAASASETTQSESIDEQSSTQQLPNPAIDIPARFTLDLTPLQDPDIYHQLPLDAVPKPFLDSEHQPQSSLPLSALLENGHFRRAAEKAVKEFLAGEDTSPQSLFKLLYIRLACLVLISRPDLAAQEAIPLLDLLARNPPGQTDIASYMPWDLRLLLVRLQSIGAVDGGRRGIMSLYALSGEMRANLRQAREDDDATAISTWSSRLQDLGLRVCDALVEMGELETATRHLDTLTNVDPDESAYRKALLRVRVGDATGVRHYAESLLDATRRKGLEALLQVADGDYAKAVESWQALIGEYPSHELFAQNAAVALLYTGHIASARDLLDDLSTRLPMFPTLLFNLSTIYELCTERALDRKTALAQKAASRKPGPESGGWERPTFDFKL